MHQYILTSELLNSPFSVKPKLRRQINLLVRTFCLKFLPCKKGSTYCSTIFSHIQKPTLRHLQFSIYFCGPDTVTCQSRFQTWVYWHSRRSFRESSSINRGRAQTAQSLLSFSFCTQFHIQSDAHHCVYGWHSTCLYLVKNGHRM